MSPELASKLIDANHILHYHSVLDAYGHISVRFLNNGSPDCFLMSRSMAPATVTSTDDLHVYRVADGEPLDPEVKHFAERYIHSEIYKRFPHVQAVVHSHSDAVVPYTISGVPLRAVFHMGGFLGSRETGVPVYDIAKHVIQPSLNEPQDMLVRSTQLGAALAQMFDQGDSVVLMRGHGMTVVGESIEEVVLRSVYTQKNAAIQTTALVSQAAFLGTGGNLNAVGAGQGLRYLSEKEAEDATGMTKWSKERPWGLWVAEVRACGLYRNETK
jgi:ribulose-5-phosphate 4-epimerase/fuculose-1-phosphate aldolase